MSMVCYPGEAAVGLLSREMNEPWYRADGLAQVIAPPTAQRPTPSRFESLVRRAGHAAPNTRDLLGVLLTSTGQAQDHGSEVLRPLWAEEAMHRAYSYARLVDTRQRRGEVTRMEDAIAGDLVARLNDLTACGEREPLPCCAVLREVTRGLGALFGAPVNVAVNAKISQVTLPAYKRRALVLAASELVSNALLHAFAGRVAGMIEVGLATHGPKSACLRVADNGVGFTASAPNLDYGLAAGLAGLLEADLTYDRVAGWTIAEISFPVSGS